MESIQSQSIKSSSVSGKRPHKWRVDRTTKRKVKIRPIEAEDIRYLWACYKQGRFQEARSYLSKAAQIEDPGPDEAVVFEHLAAVEEKLGDPKAAQENTRKAELLKGKPSSPGAKIHAP